MKLADILARDLMSWPEDFCHALLTQNVVGVVEYLVNNKQRWSSGKAFELAEDWKTAIVSKDDWLAAIKKDSKTWSGEGLPPIGTTCEWHPSVHGWVEVTILGRHGEDTWYIGKGEEHSQTCRNMSFFRPIRTAEQIAAEERKAGIAQFIQDLKKVNGNGFYSHAEDLYDMGYRKVES